MNTPVGQDLGFVLLHGSGLGAWIWELLLPDLELPALAVDLPGRGAKPADLRSLTPDDAVRSVVDDVERWGAGHLILVAHSLSGAIGLGVASQLPDRIMSLIFVGAPVPKEGEAYVSLLPPLQRIIIRTIIRRAKAGIRPPNRVIRNSLCNDLDPATANAVVERLVPEAPGLLTMPVPWQGSSATRQRFYIDLTGDRSSISPRVRQRAISHVQATDILTLDCGHLPMLSHPQELASILNSVARRVRAELASG